MHAALAEYEQAKLLERTRRGKVGRIQAGHACGSGVPFGYRYVSEPRKGYWEIDESEAAIVRQMFVWCLGGMLTRATATRLTEARVSTPSERSGARKTRKLLPRGLWGASTARQILHNPAYMGEAIWAKQCNISKTRRKPRPEAEWVRLAVPAIIHRETFATAP
jgi:site-specific DNA recombinase